MADLRACVAYLVRLRIPFAAADLATLAAVPLPRAKAYLTTLVQEPVAALRAHDPDSFVPGTYARRWLALEPKTRPGGNSSEYRRQREVRSALEHRAWLAAKAGTLVVLTSEPAGSPENQGEQQGNVPTVPATQPAADVPLTVKQAAEQLQVLPETVREWIHSGRIRAWRVGPQQIRVAQSEVTRLLTPVAPRREPKRVLVRRG